MFSLTKGSSAKLLLAMTPYLCIFVEIKAN